MYRVLMSCVAGAVVAEVKAIWKGELHWSIKAILTFLVVTAGTLMGLLLESIEKGA